MIRFGVVAQGAGVTPAQAVIANVGAGSLVGVLVAQTAAADRTYSATSDLGGTFAGQRIYDASQNRVAAILAARNAAGGDYTISVAANTGTAAFQAIAFCATGDDAAAAAIFGSFTNDPAGRTHHHAPIGEVDASTPVHVVAVIVYEANPSVASPPAAGYTGVQGVAGAALHLLFQYRETTEALTDERAAVTYAGGNPRRSVAMMAAFPKVAGAPSPPPSAGRGFRAMLLG